MLPQIVKANAVTPINARTPRCTYLHGNLENDIEFDCFYLTNYPEEWINDKVKWRLELPEGKHPVQYKGKECTMFHWIACDQPLGLCVYNDDADSYAYAEKCFNNKVISI